MLGIIAVTLVVEMVLYVCLPARRRLVVARRVRT